MKMRKLIYLLSLTLLILSLTKSANTSKDDKGNTDMKPKDDQNGGMNLMDAMIMCNETFRIEMALVNSLNESGSVPDETDRTPKCFVRCVLEKTGIATEDQYDVTKAADVFPMPRGGRTEDTKAMATACAVRTEACKCERAYQFLKCLISMEMQNNEKGGSK